jgi:hypothetical protein
MANCDIIIYNGKEYSEDDFRKYLISNGITVDQLAREKEILDKAKKLIPSMKGIYGPLLREDPSGLRQTMFEIATQLAASKSEASTALSMAGNELAELSKQLFPNVRANDNYNDIFLQDALNTIPKPASPKVLSRLKEFNDRIGVKTELVNSIIYRGKKLGANGIAIPYEGLIQIVNGKQDIAYPEETMHVAIEIIQQANSELFNALIKDVNNYPQDLNEVSDLYKNNRLYQTPEGKPDPIKLKKEAAAIVLARVFSKVIDEEDIKANIAKTRTLWQRILDWLKKLFTKAKFNPFEEASEQVAGNKEFKGDIKDIKEEEEVFLQVDKNYTFNEVNKISNTIAKSGDSYTINDLPIKNSIEKSVDKFLEGKFSASNDYLEAREAFRKETEGKIVQEISGIASRYIGDDGEVLENPITTPNTSVIDPYDTTFVDTLDKWFSEKINSYPEGTKFLINKLLYSSKLDKAGRANLIAILPVGKVDINQFKLLTIGKGKSDISQNLQGAYQTEVQGLRDILKTSYAIANSDFRETRAIPIKASYEGDEKTGFELIDLKIGNSDVELEKDLTLLPIPTISETTNYKTLDSLINRFRATVNQLAKSKVRPEDIAAKKKRIEELFAGIRQLQVQLDATKLLTSAKTLITYHKNRFSNLDSKIRETDPNIAQWGGLSKLAAEIENSRRELSPYLDTYSVMRAVYSEEDPIDFINKAKEISDDAKNLLDDLNGLQDYFRTKKFAAITPIQDELAPEKSMGWYQKFMQSLGESNIKSGHLLFFTFNRLGNLYVRRFREHMEFLENMHNKLTLEFGGNWDAIYKKIFAYDEKGRWNGNIIKKISKDFYKTIGDAAVRGDHKTIVANIDIEAYKKWYSQRLSDRIESDKLAVVADTKEESDRIKKFNFDQWVNIHDITKVSSATKHNTMLYAFPKEELWYSKEYKELLKSPGLSELYKWWQETLDHGYDLGLFQENQSRHGFFPNIYKTWLEKLSTKGGFKKGIFDPFRGLQVLQEDEAFGHIDQQTGLPLNEVHAKFLDDLGRTTQDIDGTTFKDYSLKSQDLMRAMALFAREIVLFELRTEAEPLAKLILDTEKRKKALQTTSTGKLAKLRGGDLAPTVTNATNIDYIEQHIAHHLYGQRIKGSDIIIKLKPKATFQAINKFFGTELFVIPEKEEIEISGLKFLEASNRFFRAKVLGANLLSAVSNLFGGTANTYIKGGKWFTKADALRATTRLASSHSWGSPEGHKYAALIDFFAPELNDVNLVKTRKLSTSKMVQKLSSDWLFIGMRKSDEVVNNTVLLAFIDNTLLEGGKFINIREKVKKENNWGGRLDLSRDDRETLERKVEREIEDLKKNSPNLLMNQISLTKEGNILWNQIIPDDQFIEFRTRFTEFSKAILGNTSAEDLALYKRSMVLTSFMMFKSWIPRMLNERLLPLRYAPGTNSYEYGRTRQLVHAIQNYGLGAAKAIIADLGGNEQPLLEQARQSYKKKKQEFADQNQEFTQSEADFVDNYIKGVSSSFKELGLALALMGIYLSLRVYASNNKDDSPEARGMYKYTLRAIDKLQDEISFFYNPTSFTSLFNGSIFPAVGLAVDAQKLLTNTAKYGWNWITGDEQAMEKIKFAKYIYKDLPITKELMNYLAIFSEDFAKDNGIVIQSQSGGSR